MHIALSPESPQRFVASDQKGWSLAIDPRKEAAEATSPPDLLLMSLASCTGLFLTPAAKKLGIVYEDYRIEAKGTKSQHPPNLFSSIELTITFQGSLNLGEAQQLVDEAHANCFIKHSLDPSIPIHTSVAVVDTL